LAAVVFLAVVVFLAGAAFLTAAFFAVAFLTGAAFFAVAFLTGAAFFAVAFFAGAAFLAAAFFAGAVFLAGAAFLAAGFATALAADFLTGADLAAFLVDALAGTDDAPDADLTAAEPRRAAFATAPLTDLIADVVLAATWALLGQASLRSRCGKNRG
jgi:hypothetical protein